MKIHDRRMRLTAQLCMDETYTFTPNDGTEEVHILSGSLRRWLLKHKADRVIDLTFPEQTLEEIVEQHGLEAPRMASMTAEEAVEPVIVGIWPGGTHILIDGGHRRWYWAKQGVNDIKGWAVPAEVWQLFTFTSDEIVGMLGDGSMLPQRRGK